MRNLFNFIIRNSWWLLAVLLIVFSFYLVFTQNSYQRSVYLSSANRVSAELYRLSGKLTSYFYMQKNNEELLAQNAKLQNELQSLKNYLNDLALDSLRTTSFVGDSVLDMRFRFIPANVVNVSFFGSNNYLTLDKGLQEGVKADMGVVSQKGIVGVILTASDHFSVVIPIVNSKFRLSGKLKHSENSGSIVWDGKDLHYAQLEQLPKHEVFQEGDTVVTSFSRIFPKDMIVGYVVGQGKTNDDNFNAFKIRLATDFYTLQHVLIIDDTYYEEEYSLEKSLEQR
ncbi:MAG TPA: rod shape-determining protein MreC [Dysgonamonadaceae bacterium]|jgi:rod shape-determining protein MreC|nr:rod shape-determining protein MreC [Dysgonamonadaceae bacterium]